MNVHQGEGDQRILSLCGKDEPDCDLIRETLHSAGHTVVACADLRTLCHEAENGAGALMLTEAALQEHDDCLTEVLKQQPPWADIPTIFISAHEGSTTTPSTGLDNLERLNCGGSIFFVQRPIRRDVLLLAAKSALTTRRRQHEVGHLLEQREQAEHALRESEERLALALEAGAMGAWEWHIQSGTVIWSPAMEDIYGLPRGSFEGTIEAARALVYPPDLEVHLENVQAHLRGDRSSLRSVYRVVRPDNSIIWIESLGQVVRDFKGEAIRVCGVCADITTRKQAEDELTQHRERLSEIVAERTRELELSNQQLRQAERMASMGTLAAGLGHDMGNLVFPLRIRVELLRSRDVSPELRDDLDAIHRAVQYLQRLANGLRHMGMDPSETGIGAESTDLQDWWMDMEAVLSNALPRNVTLERRFSADLPRVAVAAHGLAQAIFNLVQNAGEAMAGRDSGLIVITAERGDDHTVKLKVRDNGPGMDSDVRQRCLEPFFTTKVRSISTGLGLALVHGVVKRAGGTIDVASEPGSGTTWTLTFPTVAEVNEEQAANGASPTAAVDVDDQRVGAFVAAMLRTLEFTPLTNGTGRPEAADVWVTDRQQGMPDEAVSFVTSGDGKANRFAVLLRDEDYPSPDHPRILHSKGASSESIRRVLRELVHARRARNSPLDDVADPAASP